MILGFTFLPISSGDVSMCASKHTTGTFSASFGGKLDSRVPMT